MATSLPAVVTNVNGVLLCLKCRRSGHLVKNCPETQWLPELSWAISPARQLPNFDYDSERNRPGLCERCCALDVPELLDQPVEWTSRQKLNELAQESHRHLLVIGKTGSIQYWTGCSLCRCLFALTPNPSSEDQDVVIFPYWNIMRLEGGVDIDNEAKRRYSTCLIVTLQPSSMDAINMPFDDRVMRGDALSLLERDSIHSGRTLGGRQIRSDGIDIGLIKRWLSLCLERHDLACKSQRTDALRNIKLLDVSNTTKPQLVLYPEQFCEYIALSYVWGPIEKQSFALGPVQYQALPQTIKDAIELVSQLGKKFLWVDLVCVDQLDEKDKQFQIRRMADIYREAFATIVAISGPSANAGLPRMGSNNSSASQLKCNIHGRRMVGLMPTLSQLIWVSPWGRRAWTLQEALLSRRCLYISDFQLYFECNAMQCSESLDETRSYIHQLDRDVNTDLSEANIGEGCLRHELVVPGTQREHILNAYATRLVLYSYRSMTDPGDAINALSGIIQDWKEHYGAEFYVGLPVQYFDWGLLWTAQTYLKRRAKFPSWSWAGWEGAVWQRLPDNVSSPDTFPSYLSVHKVSQGQLQLLFESKEKSLSERLTASSGNDPIDLVGQGALVDTNIDISQLANAEKNHHLAVEGIVLHFTFANSANWPRGSSRYLVPILLNLRGVECRVCVNSSDVELQKRMRTDYDFLLVTRGLIGEWVYHWMLLLDFQDITAERVTTILLLVPAVDLQVLEETLLRKKKFILA